ncbi:MAG: radical SAM family heme chaperone HemW [Hyphomicrobiales bacterium]
MPDAPFGIYVHWPFCLAKCPYCDFNSHVRHQAVDEARFISALLAELNWFAAKMPERAVSSVFFGGGTPSLMSPRAVEQIIEAIDTIFGLAEECEITLEANPTIVEARNFAGYRAAGVNRVSVGVQALDDAALKALGRQHTSTEALAAFKLAAKTFPRVSFDMIYARPGQRASAWREELTRALGEQQGHMSLYQLTIEPETRYADLHAQGKLIVPDEDEALALYDVTQELTIRAGLSAYEVSNHAAKGHECRHNVLYWEYGDYAGIGPGAHSRITDHYGNRLAIDMVKHPETWAQRVEEGGVGISEETALSAQEQAEEYLLMGLRLTDGISMPRYEQLAGMPLPAERLAMLEEEALVHTSHNAQTLSTTPKGRRVLNAVTGYLCS